MTVANFDEVLAAAQEGAEWAWDILVRDVAPRLIGFFRTRGVADPEGLAGDVFVDLAKNITEFEGDESGFGSWVFVIAYRRMSDQWRRQRRRLDEIPSGLSAEPNQLVASAEDVAMESLGNVEAARMLETLTDDQRDVIALRIVAGLTLEETSRVVGKPISAVKALQRRGVAALRREIERQGVSQ
ncbi:MAG: RNA polymerase sigma factor [Actinomycetota bacterium]